jgi:hypothetical protein
MTNEQLKNSAMSAMRIIQEKLTIPAGHLYAELMPDGVTLSDYQKIENILVNVFKIEKSGHLLTWTRATTTLILSLKKQG